jgi:hypothetical protein
LKQLIDYHFLLFPNDHEGCHKARRRGWPLDITPENEKTDPPNNEAVIETAVTSNGEDVDDDELNQAFASLNEEQSVEQ